MKLTYDGKPIGVGDKVYQMHAAKLKVLEFTILEEFPNGNIRVSGGFPGHQIDFTAQSKAFHSNAKELVAQWVKANITNYEVEIPKVIYKLLNLYKEYGGEVEDALIARFTPVNHEEII